jgi:TET-associated glycosyltransferase-like protein
MFKDLTIFIPTLGRATSQHTWNSLSSELRKVTKLVIWEGEKDVPEYKKYPHWVCPLYPIAEKRAWIVKNCKTKYMIMLDDDILFYVRKTNDDWHLRYNTDEDTNEMFATIVELLEAGYAHVGVSSRVGNNRVEELIVENARMFGVLGYNVEILHTKVKFGRIEFQEDFEVCLQLLRQGYPNAVLYKWAHGAKISYHSKGGCEKQRTFESQNASVRRLAELHPGFVTIRQVKKKYEGEMAHRDEVIVHWKKAFESSQKVKP